MGKRARTRRRPLAIALATATLVVALAGAAQAHHGQPATGEQELGELGAGNTAGTLSTDTELTPVAKDGKTAGWEQIGGSKWQSDGSITQMAEPTPGEPSPTPYDLDFYGVDFLDPEIARQALLKAGVSAESVDEAAGIAAKTNGFAVGAQCRRTDPAQPLPPDQVADCERIPVIYRYRDDPDRGLMWEESYRGSDATDPGGYVAAVAWLGPGRALAVGGTGIYLRREPGCVTGAPDCPDPAGKARAWLYEQGAWRELTGLASGMRALTAIDASPRPSDCGASVTQECAIAGGLAQLWHFADGRFIQGYGADLGEQSGPIENASAFRFRIRDVRFFPNSRSGEQLPLGAPAKIHAAAVTVGCCSASRADDRPAWLSLDVSGWHATLGGKVLRAPLSSINEASLLKPALQPIDNALGPLWESADGAGRELGYFNPDSYYALAVERTRGNGDPDPSRDDFYISAVRTAGGPSQRYSPREPASRFTGKSLDSLSSTDPRAAGKQGPSCDDEQCAAQRTPSPVGTFGAHDVPAQGTTLGTLRLVSADGDARHFAGTGSAASNSPDGIPDWAVGVLRSSGRGVAYATAFGADRANNGAYLAKPDQCAGEEELIPDSELKYCSPEAYQRKNASKALYALPSYALNAYRVAGEDLGTGDEGAGWAVGDHGAILTRGGGVGAAEAPPAREGARSEPAPVPRPDAFEQHRPPLTDEPGTIPALGGGVRATEPAFQGPFGPGGSQSEVVMSRDGSEGWALSRFGGSLHYDGSRWAPCDAHGVPGLLPPDPACSELASVSMVHAVARVPFERDSDPTNDDEFEAVALTNKGLYRYREGGWSRDAKGVGGTDIAFTAPDDGWAVTPSGVAHFNGERWAACGTPKACDDPDGRLAIQAPCPHESPVFRLSAAGERVYLITIRDSRERPPVSVCNVSTPQWQGELYPVILYHDRGSSWQGGVDPDWQDGVDTTPEDGYNPTDGGWDPGCIRKVEDSDPTITRQICEGTGSEDDQGRMGSLAVAQDADGSFQGWALGTFGGLRSESAAAVIMRLEKLPEECPEQACWRPWTVPDATNDYLRLGGSVPSGQQLTFPSEAGRRSSFMFDANAPALAFDQQRGRWEAIPTPWAASAPNPDLARATVGGVGAVAPDGQGGFWAGSYHYTDRAPEPVFEDTPDPAGGARLTAFGSGADGTLWLGDQNGAVYRYDRLAGWSERIQIPGWDPKVVTSRAGVAAIAVGPDGEGIAVGPGGRIATLGSELRLDPAATMGCDPQNPVPPCGTGNDLLAAALAPDGSAIVAGTNRTLLWRPPAGGFRPVAEPAVPLATSIAEVEMPTPTRAYLRTGGRRVIRGEMSSPGVWSWRIEVGDAEGKPDPLTRLSSDGAGNPTYAPIADIAVDASGHGYAIGNGGLVLERTGDDDRPWRRLASGYRGNLQQVTLPAGGGEGALIGGADGLLLTLTERGLEVARHADIYDPVVASGAVNGRPLGRFVGLALIPGYRAGDVEAWGLLQGARLGQPQSLLHYPGADADPALDPVRALTALPDSPAPAPGEISFAAFGKQDCDATNRDFRRGAGNFAVRDTCGPPDGSNVTADLINRRIREELGARREGEAQAQFAIFTGDAVDKPGGREALTGTDPFGVQHRVKTPLDIDLKHRRWVEIVANRLEDAGVPVFGAIGGQDLARNAEYCDEFITTVFFGGCVNPQQAGAEQLNAQPGLNLPWRAAMASVPAPWEDAQEGGGLRFQPIAGGALSREGPGGETPVTGSQEAFAPVSNPQPGVASRSEPYPLGSGDTHYATDVYRGSEKVARIVVVDTSLRSLAASDPQQHPYEAAGQLRWLDEMTCIKTVEADPICTREPGQQAIVVSNTPTYSYGPISPEELQTDAAVFEAVLIANQANVVVSGRVGWNGRYWMIAPGVHSPCPGEPYRSDSDAPSITNPEVCGAGTGEALDTSQATEQLPDEAKQAAGLAAPSAIPFVVSSTAGGRFNERAVRGGFATAAAGFWRGYSIVRLHPSGNPAKTIVEQRPILDWVGLSARDPVVEPRRTLRLESFAREAFGMDTAPRYYEIPDTQAITHRYHLLLADPDEPWRACEASDSACEAYYSKLAGGPRSFDSAAASGSGSAQDDNGGSEDAGECEPYLCLPERVGTIDPDTGEVRAGGGKYPDTFALATLSVGEHVAAQPLVFTRSPSFIVNPLRISTPVPSQTANTSGNPDVPTPPSVPKPNVPNPSVPEPPAIPGVPPLTAAAPPEPQPPAPPAPPPPAEQPSPLGLTVSPPAITLATPTAVIQPPTPPVNPAPPGGARREARQRQAATQKSGADSAERQTDVDLAGSKDTVPGSNAMTRHDFSRAHTRRPEPSFTALARADQPSAWAQGLLYGGGIALLAATLALGWIGVRPTPRRRPPEVPAPAQAQLRRRP